LRFSLGLPSRQQAQKSQARNRQIGVFFFREREFTHIFIKEEKSLKTRTRCEVVVSDHQRRQ
jgi:hypothetical protein